MVKDPDLPVCRVGHVRVKTKHANTSNLYSHLKKHHPIEYQADRPKCNDKGKGRPRRVQPGNAPLRGLLSLPLSFALILVSTKSLQIIISLKICTLQT